MNKLQPLFVSTWKKAVLGIGPVFVLALFIDDLVRGNYIVSRDSTSFLYVIRRWFTNCWLRNDSLPHWLEGIFSGINIHTDPQLGLFSPFIWLYLVFDGYVAHQIYTLIILALGSVGMGLYIHKLFEHRPLAAFLGVAYVLCGLVFSGIHNAVFLTGMCLFPWVLWRYECLRKNQCITNSLWLALSIAWVVFEGDVFSCFWCCSYLLFDSVGKSLRTKKLDPLLISVVLAGAVAVTITAIVWLPPFETVDNTRRAVALPFEQTSYFSTHPMHLLNFIAPSLWGWSQDGTFWGHAYLHPRLPFSPRFWHDAIYMSVPLLCLFLIAIFQSFRSKQHRLNVILALLFVFISFGDHSPLHKLLYDYFPLYDKVRFPAKFLAYAHLFIFVSAARGLWHMYQKMRAGDWAALNRLLSIMAGTYLLAFVLCIVFTGHLRQWEQVTNLNLPLAQDRLTTNAVTSFLFGLICLGGFIASRMVAPKHSIATKIQFYGICILILVELLLWLPPVRTEPKTTFDETTRLENILANEGKRDTIKILRDANIDRFPGKRRSLAGRETLLHNWAILSGMSYVFGYEPTVPARFDNLSGPNVFRNLDIWLERLGITHILSTVQPTSTQLRQMTEQGALQIIEMLEEENVIVLRPTKLPAFTQLATEISLVDNGQEAYRRLSQKDRTNSETLVEKNEYLLNGRIVCNPAPIREFKTTLATKESAAASGITNLTRTPNRIEIELTTRRPVLLVVKEGFQPGWHAVGNGQELPILRVDFINMGIWIDKGINKITLDYRPRMFYLAMVPSLAGLVLVFVYLITNAMIQKRKK